MNTGEEAARVGTAGNDSVSDLGGMRAEGSEEARMAVLGVGEVDEMDEMAVHQFSHASRRPNDSLAGLYNVIRAHANVTCCRGMLCSAEAGRSQLPAIQSTHPRVCCAPTEKLRVRKHAPINIDSSAMQPQRKWCRL